MNVWARYIAPMNITFALDDALIAAAKVAAAKRGTSITSLVRAALERQVALDVETSSGGPSGVLQSLVDYSMGRLPRAVAMQALGIDDYGQLLVLLNAAQLPHPIVPLSRRQSMAADMVRVVLAQRDPA